MNGRKIEILDSTLRDGEQSPDISFSVSDKLQISSELFALGVDYIEGGNPVSSEKDREFFEQAKGKPYFDRLVAFCASRRKDKTVFEDAGLNAALKTGVKTVSVFGKSSVLHVREVLGATLEENLAMIEESVKYLKDNGVTVFYDAEHFFDAYAQNKDYALKTLQAAERGGADKIVLCDTNGGAFFDDVKTTVEDVFKVIKTPLGAHFHNDEDLAVANSLAAVDSGISHVQGTLNGIGERCGNTNLSAFLPTLVLKRGYSALGGDLSRLYDVARAVGEISNQSVWQGAPYVGDNAFAHKAGMHADGVIKTAIAFEHIAPESVGNDRKILLSDLSGRAAIVQRLKKFFPDLDKNDERVPVLSDGLKKLFTFGYKFESADASLYLAANRILNTFVPSFELVSYKCINEQPRKDDKATAIIKVRVGKDEKMNVAEGDGPVHALDNALRAALKKFYPEITSVFLKDYKVRVINKEATASVVRVLITSSDGVDNWTTVGVDQNVITASLVALVDSMEYRLHVKNAKK